MPKYDDAYRREVDFGTAVKLFEYETSVGQSNVLMKDGLLYALERLMPEIALPVRLHECRGYAGVKERSFETPIAGIVVRLETVGEQISRLGSHRPLSYTRQTRK